MDLDAFMKVWNKTYKPVLDEIIKEREDRKKGMSEPAKPEPAKPAPQTEPAP